MRRAKPRIHASARPRPWSPVFPFLARLAVRLRAALTGGRRGMRTLLRRLRRQPGHLLRVLGRLKTRSSARRRGKTETEIE